jgi:hypothetical protein
VFKTENNVTTTSEYTVKLKADDYICSELNHGECLWYDGIEDLPEENLAFDTDDNIDLLDDDLWFAFLSPDKATTRILTQNIVDYCNTYGIVLSSHQPSILSRNVRSYVGFRWILQKLPSSIQLNMELYHRQHIQKRFKSPNPQLISSKPNSISSVYLSIPLIYELLLLFSPLLFRPRGWVLSRTISYGVGSVFYHPVSSSNSQVSYNSSGN